MRVKREWQLPALCCRSLSKWDAAVQSIEPAIRCDREIQGWLNLQIADFAVFRCGCAKVYSGEH